MFVKVSPYTLTQIVHSPRHQFGTRQILQNVNNFLSVLYKTGVFGS